MFLIKLKLENDKRYVGRSNDLESELKIHKLGKKTSWTKLYIVKSVEEKDLGESLREVTIRYYYKSRYYASFIRKEGYLTQTLLKLKYMI